MTSAGTQGSLFAADDAEPTVTALGPSVRRRVLTAGAWVDVRPGFIDGANALFDLLRDEVPWRAERRQMYDRVVDVPRLLCTYHEDDPLPHPVLDAARDALTEHYRDELPEGFATAGMCCYRDGSDSVTWHGDTIGRGSTENTMVAIVSLGSPRPLMLRPRGGGASLRFVVSPRRPAGDGRQLPAHLGARGAEGDRCRPPDQRAVPAARGVLGAQLRCRR